MDKFNTISSVNLQTNPYWNYNLDEYVLPNGNTGKYYYVNSNGSCFIIPITSDKKLLFTRQFRYLNKKYSLEFPGGGMKPGISFFENSIEELQEETGFTAGKIEYLGEFNPCNGMTNEICKVFVAWDLMPSKLPGDESEEIEVVPLDFNQVSKLIQTNEIWDGMTLASISLFYNSNFFNELL